MVIEHELPVPHLTTAQTGPLRELEEHLLQHQTEIEEWFRARWAETPPPFYASVDLRNAGFKLAPIDTNLFPAGFNNLNPAFQPLCVQALQSAVKRFCAKAARILIVPESHTRNLHYLDNVVTLQELLKRAGFDVRIGSLLPDMEPKMDIALPSGRGITLERVQRIDNKVHTEGFTPCMVLLNNDLSGGRPPLLENLQQPVAPPLELGWWKRFKSDHFAEYRRLAVEFAELVDIDPWLIDPAFRRCGKIDFHAHEGEDCLAKNVSEMLDEIRRKYKEHGIEQEPFVIVKDDAGTYGMAIMTVRNADEVRSLNRKQRTKMAVGKEGHLVRQVMIQEGVYTFETWGDPPAVAEPVVYMIDRFVVGGFYRVHTRRGQDENLNAPGAQFVPLAFADPGTQPDPTQAPDAEPNRFYAYGVIARLALLAAARELIAHQPVKNDAQP